MFETAELGREIGKKEFETLSVALRTELLDLQQRLRGADFPVIVVIAGLDGAGKGDTVNLLNEWMDPRWLTNRAYSAPTDEEQMRPEYWRYWRDLPPKGTIGLFLSSWYSRPVLEYAHGRMNHGDFDDELARILAFERTLADDGALLIKFWLHLGKDAQKKRFKHLEKDPAHAWRVTETDWQHWRMYDRFIEAAERTLMPTSTGAAPWHIVEGADDRYRAVAVTTRLRDALVRHLAARGAPKTEMPLVIDGEAPVQPPPLPTILETLDMTRAVARKAYKKELPLLQGRLAKLQRRARSEGVSSLLVFEGWDAAGKGGSIRRVAGALDARDYDVLPFAAPNDEERAQHYLWRFWRRLGRAGRVTIFDRSWYGRVLVERVEGFARRGEWMRAYAEINDFEEQLVDHGIVLVKYWLHLTSEEQLTRFEARQSVPYKSWKLTPEDWRNRDKWGDYEQAVNAMVERTSTRLAPWTLVEANDKNYARLKVLRTFCDALEARLKG